MAGSSWTAGSCCANSATRWLLHSNRRMPARFAQPVPDSHMADKRDTYMKNMKHLAAVLAVFALATSLQWVSAAAAAETAPAAPAAPAAGAKEPIHAGRWVASSPAAERNIRNFKI